MSHSVRTHNDFLQALHKLKPNYKIALLKAADDSAINCICECIYNVLKGSLPISKKEKTKLSKHKNTLRELVRKGYIKKKKKIIIQKGGAFLPIILSTLLSGVLSSLIQ